MEVEKQMLNGFPGGKKSEHTDVISFKKWAESWYNRQNSGDWISKLSSEAKRRYLTVNDLKGDYIKTLYEKVIVRLNVLLKLKIAKNGIFDLNGLANNGEMYRKMLEYLYNDKKLFWHLNPKEIELFELLLAVMDENKNNLRPLRKDKWECIALSEREKICDILHYLVWELDWDESHFANLGLVPWDGIPHNRFRIIGRSLCDYDDSSYKDRAFSDYNVRLLHPKEYRLSCSLDHIYTSIEGIASCITGQEYENMLDRTITRIDKISKSLEKEYADRRQSSQKSTDKMFGDE